MSRKARRQKRAKVIRSKKDAAYRRLVEAARRAEDERRERDR